MVKRYKPSATRQADLLTEWQNRCAYCRLPFGLLIWRQGVGNPNGRGHYFPTRYASISLSLEWDHFVPFTYSDSCDDVQFLPACQLCNRIKGDRVYRTIEGAREAIEPIWIRRYELADGPVRGFVEAQKREMEADGLADVF